ncbi:YodL domain-containing protein [Anaerotignum sp.]|uniref:YodL domain-containing protein n=1 Tax=Anaerotignum sp. TaxID=2039241 RepID=UPI0028A5F98A|nr:YodL domain-containing protein [Anaerotignum sp.]
MAADAHDFPFNIQDVSNLLRLKIRRPSGNGVYVDCPICGDRRGKMRLDYEKNFWRCNYCGKSGGMLALYADVHGISKSDAYREICEALGRSVSGPDYKPVECVTVTSAVVQSPLASIQQIHQTLSLLLNMLSLSEKHQRNLQERGLSKEQIDRLGYKSTPPPYLCRSYTDRLLRQGCVVQGVPGFYLDDDGKWTVKFYKRTAGIIAPCKGIDGLIRGAQIRLDVPIKDKDDPPEKAGTKYLWLSSSNKNMGVSSGSPVHFVGDPFANTVYVTEGIIKSDVSHFLMDRTFAAIAGANNTTQLDMLFAFLAQNGSKLIVEAHDMDKYANEHVSGGASKIYLMARSHGMGCRRLTWNPNYKGIDDWQYALKKKEQAKKEVKRMNFKQRFLAGLCNMDTLDDEVKKWHTAPKDGTPLATHLGLSEEEYSLLVQNSDVFEQQLFSLRKRLQFRIYQLEFSDDIQTKPYAFRDFKEVKKLGYEQPPAADYRLTEDSSMYYTGDPTEMELLGRIFERYNDDLPKEYTGRSLSPSDIVELYDNEKRRYFYCNPNGFLEVRFSPRFALPMKPRI